MEDFLFITKDFLIEYGSVAVFLSGIIEEILFVIPSSPLFMAVGFFMIPASLSFWPALLMVLTKMAIWGALGITIGSFLTYGLAYWGGKPLIKKYGKFIGVSWDKVEKIENQYSKTKIDELGILFFRAIPVLPITVVSVFCGIVRISWKTFAIYTFLGTIVRVIITGMIGWYAGAAYRAIGDQFDQLELYGTIGLGILLVAGFYYFFVIKKNKKTNG